MVSLLSSNIFSLRPIIYKENKIYSNYTEGRTPRYVLHRCLKAKKNRTQTSSLSLGSMGSLAEGVQSFISQSIPLDARTVEMNVELIVLKPQFVLSLLFCFSLHSQRWQNFSSWIKTITRDTICNQAVAFPLGCSASTFFQFEIRIWSVAFRRESKSKEPEGISLKKNENLFQNQPRSQTVIKL